MKMSKLWLSGFGILFFLTVNIVSAAEFDHSHSIWSGMLKSYVKIINSGNASQVNYAKFKKDEGKLDSYLAKLSSVKQEEFKTWDEKQQLSFLINAYNAFTVKLILSKYPNLKSIKDLGGFFSSPWKKNFFELFGEKSNLDHLEHDLIRKKFKEPRIHFAVNCASIGCPMLPNEAFLATSIEEQLENGIRRFLSDRSRNRYNDEKDVIELSSIFKWYGSDFEKGYLGFKSISDVAAKYAALLTNNPKFQAKVRTGKVKIIFLEYDWKLNSVK